MKSIFQFARLVYRVIRSFLIYLRFRGFTMIRAPTYIINLLVAERFRSIEGLVVECGVWRGGMMAGIATVLGRGRQYCLFDSFEGLPPAKANDGDEALAWQADKGSANYRDNCRAEESYAQAAMKLAGVPRFTTVKGWFNETLPKFVPESRIAILRLDGDWYESTMECLNALYRHVRIGGVIIIDDYYTWAGCSRAVHDFLSQHDLEDVVRQYFNGVCYIVKKKELTEPADRTAPAAAQDRASATGHHN